MAAASSSVGNNPRVNNDIPDDLNIATADEAKDRLRVAACAGDLWLVAEVNAAFPLSNIDHLEGIVEFAAQMGKINVVWRIIDLHGKNANRLFNVALAAAATTVLDNDTKTSTVISILQCAHSKNAKPIAEMMLGALLDSFGGYPHDLSIRNQLLTFCCLADNELERRGYRLIRSALINDPEDYRKVLDQESKIEIPSLFFQYAERIAEIRADQTQMMTPLGFIKV